MATCLAPSFSTIDLGFLYYGFRERWMHVQGMMWPDLVVLAEPDVDGDLGLFRAVEPFGVENFSP